MSQFLSYPGAAEALMTLLAVGGLLGVVGVPMVLTGRSFSGLVLAAAAGLGGTIGHITGLSPWLLAFVASLGSLAAVELLPTKRGRTDGTLAAAYIFLIAAATLIISKLPCAHVDILRLQFGNILTLPRPVALRFVVLAGVGIAYTLTVQRHVLAAVGDKTCAALAGLRPRIALAGHALLVSLAVTLGLEALGIIPVCACLVSPGYIALRLARSRAGWTAIALAVTSTAASIGLVVAFALDFPPGVFVAGLLGGTALLVWLLRG